MLPLCIDQIGQNFTGRRVLIRVDFNVPMKDGKLTNNQKIIAACPTIRYALEKGASKVILITHLGQPDGMANSAMSLKPVVPELQAILGRTVTYLPDCVGPKVEMACSNAEPGSVILLENLRFHVEEEGNGDDVSGNKKKADAVALKNFRASLSRLGDIYVNDAIGASNRPNSSVVGIKLALKVCGFLMRTELKFFKDMLERPARPFVVILGGHHVLDKVRILEKLLENLDDVLLGAEVALTFLNVLNKMEIGNSTVDETTAELVEEVVANAKSNNVRIHLPLDFVTADDLHADAMTGIATSTSGIPADRMAVDIGPRTSHEFAKILEGARTIFWYGAPGEFEFDLFSGGTKALMDALVKATRAGAITITAGNKTVCCAKKFNSSNKISHVSTGGKACVEFLLGRPLPGVDALDSV